MNIKKQITGMITIMLLILVSGCTTAAPTPDLAATIAVNVAVEQTMAALQTQTSLTEIAYLQQNPTETPTPSPTPTSAYTATPDKVTVSVSKDTYCRDGIFAKSPFVALMSPGQSYDVLAVNPDKSAYYVVEPKHTFTYCWLWGEFATISGDTANLPVYTPQPLPTPTYTPTVGPDFTISYLNSQDCSGAYYLRFFIKNNGSKIWQTVQIDIKDNTNASSSSHINTAFVDYNGCTAGITEADLTPGEGASVAAYDNGQLTVNPAGHSVTAFITLCQMDSFGGCQSKSITFTP
ncbi:MAG: hypothetical protein C0410_12040 [Anaerolinea sp.]|nr:hypothetical protein [Anaerolinea sp.]